MLPSFPPYIQQRVEGSSASDRPSGSSVSGARDGFPSHQSGDHALWIMDGSIGEHLRMLALTIPGAGVASNETVAMLPHRYWGPLASELREKAESLSRLYRLSPGNPPPVPGNWGASASGPQSLDPTEEPVPQPVPTVDPEQIMSLPLNELTRLAHMLGASASGQTVADMQTAVILALLEEQDAAMKEQQTARGASASGSTAAPPPTVQFGGGSASGSTTAAPPPTVKFGASASSSTPAPQLSQGWEMVHEHEIDEQHPNPLHEDADYGEF